MLLLVAAWVLRHKKPKLAQALFVTSMALLYLLSIPPVSHWLSRSTEARPALSLEDIRSFQPQAIVILGGGVNFEAEEYGGRTVPSSSTLKRAAYASYLAKALHLPLITTGGYGKRLEDSEGYATAWQLQENGFSEVLIESKSENTRENALFTKALAAEKKIDRVLIVTHSGHAARAERAFLKAGFQAKVAPTDFRKYEPWDRGILLFIPTHKQFHASCDALRAHLASLFYLIRG